MREAEKVLDDILMNPIYIVFHLIMNIYQEYLYQNFHEFNAFSVEIFIIRDSYTADYSNTKKNKRFHRKLYLKD